MSLNTVLQEKPSKRIKNTNCSFSLAIKLLKAAIQYNSEIEIEWNHNHPVQALHSLSFKDIAESTLERINSMFKNGLLPGAVHKELMRQLRSECKTDLEYHLKLADRSIIPRRMDFNTIYRQFTNDLYGTKSLESMFESLEKRIASLKEKDNNYSVKHQRFDEDINQPFILVIITPLMQRVHRFVSIQSSIK